MHDNAEKKIIKNKTKGLGLGLGLYLLNSEF